MHDIASSEALGIFEGGLIDDEAGLEIDDFEDVERPPDPDINEPRLIDDAGPAPNEPTLQPYIPPAGEPVNTAIAPDPRVDLEDIVVPEMDAYTLPDLPTLYELDLPDVPRRTRRCVPLGFRPSSALMR